MEIIPERVFPSPIGDLFYLIIKKIVIEDEDGNYFRPLSGTYFI